MLNDAKRTVIKIGSALVADEGGSVHTSWLASLASDIAQAKTRGQQVILVSSGAVALGRKALGLSKDQLKLEEKQAAAACGQIDLTHAYEEQFAVHNTEIAQILLTIEDSDDRRRYLNARNTLETLLSAGVLPIINENDTVATEEIRFGDNDRLAARVAQMVEADLLILLSDVDGLYSADPSVDSAAEHIAEVTEITDEIEQMAGSARTQAGSGGMVTKLLAAKIATGSGCHTIVSLGKIDHPIKALEDGAKHTLFVAGDTPHNARKRWIAHSLQVMGALTIDDGARAALQNGKSLLPAGVTAVSGNFERGDAVQINDSSDAEIGRGLVAFSSSDAAQIIGKNSSEIEEILGFTGREELIHRDDMVLS